TFLSLALNPFHPEVLYVICDTIYQVPGNYPGMLMMNVSEYNYTQGTADPSLVLVHSLWPGGGNAACGQPRAITISPSTNYAYILCAGQYIVRLNVSLPNDTAPYPTTYVNVL